MASSKPLRKLFLAVLILLLNHRITASTAPSLGYDGDETEALYVLKAAFNNPFLNGNWTSIHCHMDNPRWYGIQCNNGRVTAIVLEGMGLKGLINFDALIHFSELSILSFKNNELVGNIMNFSGNQKLAQINLSGNKFHSPISESLLSLASLASLQLQNNSLTGKIPEFNQPTLVCFNVSNNNLSGQIPLTQVVQSFSSDSFLGNPGLCGPPTLNSCNNSSIHDSVGNGPSSSNPSGTADNETKKNKQSPINNGFAILFLLLDVVALVAVILLFILYNTKAKKLKKIMNKQNRQHEEADEENEERSETVESSRVVERGEDRGKLLFLENGGGFELSDLLKASAEGLGKGILGNTYKAILDNGQALVVKKMRDLKPMTSEEFTRQLQLLANQKHPNLIPPLAYYFSKQEKLLIYRYAEKGNLFNRIHGGRGSKERVPFRWHSRLAAARGVARALHYLHVSCNSRPNVIIPHGNLKSTNVLLNQNDIILVSDYSLPSLIALPIAAQSMVCFKSPEYQTTQRISPKTDVWSYGCLLLELLSGRVWAHAAPPGVKGVDLCSWVHRAVREEWTAEIFDSEISVQRNAAHGMLQLLQIAIRCCEKSPDKRPDMAEIAQEIENMKVAVDSENDEDVSIDQSLTDESFSTTLSIAAADDR